MGDTLRLTMAGGTLEIPADDLLRIDPEDTFLPVKVKLLDVPYASLIADSARTHGVAPELVASVIAVESNFNPNAVSWRDRARADAAHAGNSGAARRQKRL